MEYLDKLRESHPLFDLLRKDNPAWWRLFKAQKGCYIHIRKDNSINLYYRGASVFRVSLVNKALRFETAYPERRLVGENITQSDIDEIKTCIENNPKFADGSESAIKAGIILNEPNKYIDSEMAEHALRVDLVRLDGNEIQFVELKCFGDNRLLKKSPSQKPEIVSQREKYNEFICNNKSKLIEYYHSLLKIRSSLGLFTGPIPDDLSIADQAVLMIDMTDYGTCPTDGKKKRLERINNELPPYEAHHPSRD